MILAGLVSFSAWAASWAVQRFPVMDTAWLANFQQAAARLLHPLVELNDILPVTDVFIVAGVFLSYWVVAMTATAVRKVWSLITGGGGA